jgi:uncharacterized protein
VRDNRRRVECPLTFPYCTLILGESNFEFLNNASIAMNLQERQTLERFLNQLAGAQAANKDAEADGLIRSALAAQPDAGYLLVQRAILLEQALDAAKAQIGQLQAAQSAPGGRSGFLGANPWAPQGDTVPPSAGVPGASGYQLPRSAPAYAAPAAGGGASSFLGNVATTAAGVVAGSFLFQGIENLMGHHSSPWMSSADPDLGRGSENTVVNNYYGSEPNETPQSDWGGGDSNLASDDDGDFQDSGDDSSWV